MRPSRESIFSALFAQLQTIPGLQTVSRRLQNVQDMAPESMPAAFQIQGAQEMKFKGDVPAVGDWSASWILYASATDTTQAPSTQLNALVDAALAVLVPKPYADRQTLGGLVEYAAVDGKIDIFEGVLGDRAVAVIPIRLIVAGF